MFMPRAEFWRLWALALLTLAAFLALVLIVRADEDTASARAFLTQEAARGPSAAPRSRRHIPARVVAPSLPPAFRPPYCGDGWGDARPSLETVATVAGLITVSRSFAPPIRAFIADLAGLGYRPHHIGCYAHGGHVSHSLHYSGNACDFDQSGWGKTAVFMHHIGRLAAKYGLRDGCSFGDCGHIDAGRAAPHRFASR